MKFDKIKKFWAVLENLAQNEIFDHTGPARMKFGKIQKLQAVLKIWLKSRFLTTPDLWKKFWKIQNFQSHWIFDSKLTRLTTTDLGRLKSLTTQDMQRMKFGKIQKLQAVLKIWLKSRFLTTPDLWKKFWKIQNFQSHWIFDSKLTCLTTTDLGRLKSLTTQDMQRMKVGKIQKFLVALKIWRKNWFWEFWPLGTCEGWNFAKSRNFQSRWKFGLNMRVLTTANHQRMKFDKIHKNFDLCWKFDPKMRFLTMTSRPAKDEVWQNSEIFSRVENLAHIMRVLTPRTSKGWNLAKFRNF